MLILLQALEQPLL